MRVLKMFLFSVLFTTGLAMAQAPSVEPYNAPEPCLTIEACVNHYAYKYDVDEAMMFKIIKCESSNYKWAHNKTEKEDSWGWVQINTAAHDVSIAQATDLEFAVNFLADNLSKGNAPQMWYTCYRKQYDKT